MDMQMNFVRKIPSPQELKEQYWKRTYGPVRTALEKSLEIIDRYGVGVEMGHKEVGGVKSQITSTGSHEHIMEQLEIKDSTLRFHNRNIYTKLGINSLKQLQQCIAVLHSDGTGTALPEPPHETAEPENKEDELPMTD